MDYLSSAHQDHHGLGVNDMTQHQYQCYGSNSHHTSCAGINETSSSSPYSSPLPFIFDDWSSNSWDSIGNQSIHISALGFDGSLDVNYVASLAWAWVSAMPKLLYLVWPTQTMFPSLEKVPRYVTEMFPVFFVMAIIENGIRILQGRSIVRLNESVSSISQGIFQECLRIKLRSFEVLMYCLIWNNFRLIELPWDSLLTWWLCYVGVDLGFYWAHRLAHEVNFIWAIHQAHHNATEFSIVSALRQAVLQPFTAWITYTPLALFIPPPIFLAHIQLTELYMAWLHTEVVDTIGPLEWVLNTPSHHRVHHGRNPEYIDKNYGAMLIVWDRLFGTFKQEDRERNPPVYGLVHPTETYEPFEVQFHTWPVIWRRIKAAESWTEALGVLFMGPGWRNGLPRLGDPSELPTIRHPVEPYNPQISLWKSGYVLVHFTIVLLFYHELTLYQGQFSPWLLNIGVASLVMSITTLGIMLDNKQPFNCIFELLRCLLFFRAKQLIGHVIDHGFNKANFSQKNRNNLMQIISIIFAISVIVQLLELTTNLIKYRLKRFPSTTTTTTNKIKSQ